MDTLLTVISVSEAAKAWGKHPNTVRGARDAKHNALEYRLTPHDCLVTVESCKRRWGEPKIPLETLLRW